VDKPPEAQTWPAAWRPPEAQAHGAAWEYYCADYRPAMRSQLSWLFFLAGWKAKCQQPNDLRARKPPRLKW